MQTQLEPLLDKLEVIRLRQELTPLADKFNIFSILRSESDEVNLHSRFLFELLNPKGSHGMGTTFLILFAETCQLPPLNYENIQVRREHANIDILIQDNLHAVVVENKIYAGDQHEQLKRYHNYAVQSFRKPTLIYLTLNGKEPSSWSTSDLEEQVQLISYGDEIDHWLTACIKEAVSRPALRETIAQYQILIRRLTGQNMNENEKQEVLRLMQLENNAERAVILTKNWGHVRWHTERDFWRELLALIEITHSVAPGGRVTDDALDKVVHGRRGKNPWYGLSFLVGTLNGNDVNLRIERNEGPMYYGFPYCSSDEAVRTQLLNALKPFVTQQTSGWAGLKENDCGLDFQNFRSPFTLQLANPDKRKANIAKLWLEITAFSYDTTLALQNEFGAAFISINGAPQFNNFSRSGS